MAVGCRDQACVAGVWEHGGGGSGYSTACLVGRGQFLKGRHARVRVLDLIIGVGGY